MAVALRAAPTIAESSSKGSRGVPDKFWSCEELL